MKASSESSSIFYLLCLYHLLSHLYSLQLWQDIFLLLIAFITYSFFFFFLDTTHRCFGDSFTSKVKIHTCNKRLIKRQIATLQQLYRVICIAFHFVWICIQQHWRRLSVPVHCLDLPRPEHKATAKHWSGLADLTHATAHSQLGTA